MTTPYDSRPGTLEHIAEVQERLRRLRADLSRRTDHHDASKLESPEVEGFDYLGERQSSTVYGTPEYFSQFEEPVVKDAVSHHYAENRHHPEHFPNGVNDMTLVDLVEMLCDWSAAGTRYKDSSIEKSLAHNTERFGLSEQLVRILANTAREYGL